MRNILKILSDTADCSDCVRLKVGAVLTRDGKVIATGFNYALGTDDCHNHFRDRSADEVRLFHSDFSDRYEIHAEAMAICQCAADGISARGATLYVTHSPCMECAKLIAASGISEVRYLHLYKNGEGLRLLKERGISYGQIAEEGS